MSKQTVIQTRSQDKSILKCPGLAELDSPSGTLAIVTVGPMKTRMLLSQVQYGQNCEFDKTAIWTILRREWVLQVLSDLFNLARLISAPFPRL